MATLISHSNFSIAWLEAMEYLQSNRGEETNLIVAMGPGEHENPDVRAYLDAFLSKYETDEIRNVRKVADTIFPVDLYNANSENALDAFFERQEDAWLAERDYLRRGKYIQRLTDWRKQDQKSRKSLADTLPINQLRRVVNKLIRHRTNPDRPRHNGSAYEMAVSTVDPDEGSEQSADKSFDLRIYDPERDNIEMGFPCLSHISLTLYHDRLDMTALYRNQYFITKAYGNFLGLLDLLTFISIETGYHIGQLVCIATHANGELSGRWSDDVKTLITEARASANRLTA